MSLAEYIELASVLVAATGVLVTLGIWSLNRREKRHKVELAEVAKQAHDEGVVAAQGEAARAATKALHDRLDEYRDRIESLEKRAAKHELIMAAADIYVPEGSQAGPDGRGVKNPLR